jgi:hypothetical protein
MDRRQFLNLMALGGGAVLASALPGCSDLAGSRNEGAADFYFVQLSDTHWGYKGPDNPNAHLTLATTVATVNALETRPDFIVFTGDLTHTTDDPAERRRRMHEFRRIVADLNVKTCASCPENTTLPSIAARRSKRYSARRTTLSITAACTSSRSTTSRTRAQRSARSSSPGSRAISTSSTRPPRSSCLTHRPLFDLVPKWDWATRDGAQAMALLMPYRNVTVFYGHIHQEHHHMTGHIAHHSAKSLVFPLPAPGSQEKRTPLPWDPAAPYRGLGFREVEASPREPSYALREFPVVRS